MSELPRRIEGTQHREAITSSREADRGQHYRDLLGQYQSERLAGRPELQPAIEIPPPLSRAEPMPVKEMEPRMSKMDADHGVQYLSPEEREEYRAVVHEGKVYGADGLPLDTSRSQSLHHGAGFAIYVMDSNGNTYISPTHEFGSFHHSSFLAGEAVAGAGEMKIREGRVEALSNTSGHYRPDGEYLKRVADELNRQGLTITKDQLHEW